MPSFGAILILPLFLLAWPFALLCRSCLGQLSSLVVHLHASPWNQDSGLGTETELLGLHTDVAWLCPLPSLLVRLSWSPHPPPQQGHHTAPSPSARAQVGSKAPII